jgi:hypothetical protein
MRRPPLILGVILGAVNALPFIALDYLGRWWARISFRGGEDLAPC